MRRTLNALTFLNPALSDGAIPLASGTAPKGAVSFAPLTFRILHSLRGRTKNQKAVSEESDTVFFVGNCDLLLVIF